MKTNAGWSLNCAQFLNSTVQYFGAKCLLHHLHPVQFLKFKLQTCMYRHQHRYHSFGYGNHQPFPNSRITVSWIIIYNFIFILQVAWLGTHSLGERLLKQSRRQVCVNCCCLCGTNIVLDWNTEFGFRGSTHNSLLRRSAEVSTPCMTR